MPQNEGDRHSVTIRTDLAEGASQVMADHLTVEGALWSKPRSASLVANFNIDVALDRYGVATRIVDQEVPYTYLSATLSEAIIAFFWLAN